jgi:hypothetical protein
MTLWAGDQIANDRDEKPFRRREPESAGIGSVAAFSR